MKVLSIDPGMTTGWCLLNDTMGIEESGIIQFEPSGYRGVRFLDNEGLFKYFEFSKDSTIEVVIEEIPLPTGGRLVRSLRAIIDFHTEMFPEAIWIVPGVWKSNPNVQKSTPVSLRTQHEKDAWGLGVYYILFGRNKK